MSDCKYCGDNQLKTYDVTVKVFVTGVVADSMNEAIELVQRAISLKTYGADISEAKARRNRDE
jgi:hypothetical protein